MDELKFGKIDARGGWAPDKPISYGPAFAWPPQPKALFKWFFGFPGYFLPWNLLYAFAAILIWLFLTPSLETMKNFSF
ncbi:MAG: sterol desaturase family protein, partial [Hyphomicrobiales bacterium]